MRLRPSLLVVSGQARGALGDGIGAPWECTPARARSHPVGGLSFAKEFRSERPASYKPSLQLGSQFWRLLAHFITKWCCSVIARQFKKPMTERSFRNFSSKKLWGFEASTSNTPRTQSYRHTYNHPIAKVVGASTKPGWGFNRGDGHGDRDASLSTACVTRP